MKNKDTRAWFGLLLSLNSPKIIASLFGLVLLTVSLSCLSPLVQKHLLDSLNAGSRKAWFFLVLLAFLLLILRSGVSASVYLSGRIAVTLRTGLRERMFRHLLNLPAGFLKGKGPGYFFNRMQIDINDSATFLSTGCVSVFENFLKVLLAWGTILYLQWRCGLLVLPFTAAQFLICLYFRGKQYRLSHRISEQAAGERYRMQTMLENHVLLKTHVSGDRAAREIRRGLSVWGKLMRSRIGNEMTFRLMLQLPVGVCCSLVTAIGVYGVLEHRWTIGELWAVIALLFLVFQPVRMLGENLLQSQSAFAAWVRLNRLFAIAAETDSADPSGAPIRLNGEIAFDRVTFAYPGGPDVLRNFTRTFPAGCLCYLTGRNGSGKSTFLALLLRLCEPGSGEIRIGGVPIGKYSLSGYRSRIGYISQRPEFVPGTLREVLRGDTEGKTDADLYDAIRRAGLEHRISPVDGLDLRVAENADNFSGGEKLRIALARELLRDTDILIFDEAAANLDSEGEMRFNELLRTLSRRQTVFSVTHRLPPDPAFIVDLSHKETFE